MQPLGGPPARGIHVQMIELKPVAVKPRPYKLTAFHGGARLGRALLFPGIATTLRSALSLPHPMPCFLQRWLPLVLVAFLALWIRVWHLDQRPMHADEANQAVKAGKLLEGQGYTFDPADHHGPTLYYAVLPLAWMRGEHTLASLTATTVRLVPMIAGAAGLALLFFLALPLGRNPAFYATGFFAFSPPVLYYSRYFIQESLLLTFILGTLLCARQWWRTGQLGWVIGTGVCAGLMQATKASAPLFFLAAVGGLCLARPGRPASARLGRDLGLALLAAVLVAALFYSSFGAHPRGLIDAFGTYFASGRRLGGDTGHEKPWWYYLSLFGWQRNDGVVTHQIAFSLLALAGLAVAFRSRQHVLLRWAAGYTLAVLVVLSVTPYKTPWHAIHLVPGMALLAVGAIAALPERWTYFGQLATGLVFLTLGTQARLVAFDRPADERNPYAYVHTSPDVLKLRPLAAAAPAGPIRVISEEAWPLPWYLRDRPDVGYWTAVPDDCDGALVIVSAGLAEQVKARLKDRYTYSFVGLRPGFTLLVFKRKP